MKKGSLLKAVFGLIAAGFGIYFIRKKFKKERKKLDEEEEKIDEFFDNLGVSKEKMMEQLDPEEKLNLCKKLCAIISFGNNKNWDDSMIDPEEWLNGKDHVIHVSQFFAPNGHSFLDFLIEIPLFHKPGNYNSLKVGDYISSCSSLAEILQGKVWSNLREGKTVDVEKIPKVRKKLVGFFAISYDNPNYDPEDNNNDELERISEYIPIYPYLYLEFKDDKGHDGLVDYIQELKRASDGAKKYIATARQEIFKERPDLSEKNLKIEEPVLMYSISFPVDEPGNLNFMGIWEESALDCLTYMTTDFEITRGSKTVTYENVVFHALNPNRNYAPDLTWYYYKNTDKNSIEISNFSY